MAASLHPGSVTARCCGSGCHERIQHDVAGRPVEAAEAMTDELSFNIVMGGGGQKNQAGFWLPGDWCNPNPMYQPSSVAVRPRGGTRRARG
jgi:hypothetical protein